MSVFKNVNVTKSIKMTSTTDAFNMPSVTTAQRDAIPHPEVGSLVFNNETENLELYKSQSTPSIPQSIILSSNNTPSPYIVGESSAPNTGFNAFNNNLNTLYQSQGFNLGTRGYNAESAGSISSAKTSSLSELISGIKGEWVTLDLGQEYLVNSVNITGRVDVGGAILDAYFDLENPPYSFNVVTSTNNSTWSVHYTHTGSSGLANEVHNKTFLFNQVSARYIGIIVTQTFSTALDGQFVSLTGVTFRHNSGIQALGNTSDSGTGDWSSAPPYNLSDAITNGITTGFSNADGLKSNAVFNSTATTSPYNTSTTTNSNLGPIQGAWVQAEILGGVSITDIYKFRIYTRTDLDEQVKGPRNYTWLVSPDAVTWTVAVQRTEVDYTYVSNTTPSFVEDTIIPLTTGYKYVRLVIQAVGNLNTTAEVIEIEVYSSAEGNEWHAII